MISNDAVIGFLNSGRHNIIALKGPQGVFDEFYFDGHCFRGPPGHCFSKNASHDYSAMENALKPEFEKQGFLYHGQIVNLPRDYPVTHDTRGFEGIYVFSKPPIGSLDDNGGAAMKINEQAPLQYRHEITEHIRGEASKFVVKEISDFEERLSMVDAFENAVNSDAHIGAFHQKEGNIDRMRVSVQIPQN